jgi:AraC-like DNA-binding protein
MVCPRCIAAVSEILTHQGIPFLTVKLGEIALGRPLTSVEFTDLQVELKKLGFEIIAEKNERLVTQIKSIIIAGIYEDRDFKNKNLSVILSDTLHYDYSHLSSIFSKEEGKSIQNFQQDIKIERIKELLEYDELSISEIAQDMGYGSAAYLSTQFKKITGVTPSQYKANNSSKRDFLDIF